MRLSSRQSRPFGVTATGCPSSSAGACAPGPEGAYVPDAVAARGALEMTDIRPQEGVAMYATVRVYEMAGEWDDEMTRHLEQGFIPLLEAVSGFVAYYPIDADPGLFASVTVCVDRAGAEESNQIAARYIAEYLADRFPSAAEVTQARSPFPAWPNRPPSERAQLGTTYP